MSNGWSNGPANGRLRRMGTLLLSLILDILIVLGAYALALNLKFDGEVPGESWRTLAWAGPLIGVAYIMAYQAFGVYRTAWQYGSLRDALLLGIAVAIVTGGILVVNALLPTRPLPLTVNVISAAFILLGHGCIRILPRIWNTTGLSESVNQQPRQRVLIVGANDTGQLLAWELLNNRGQAYRPVCFIDDDPSLHKKRIHGIPVAGGRESIPEAIARYRVNLAAVALPPESPDLQEVLGLLEPARVQVRLVPGLADVMEGRARRGEMREITMEDLLARAPMAVDEDACRSIIEGRVVLITGAAGSIGAELTRRVMDYGPTALHLIDMNETGLHELRVEMLQKSGGNVPVKPWLCNIADRQKLDDIFESSRPQVVFHLGSYKHLGMMEENPDQAFENIVLGTLNVFEAAQAVQAEKVAFVSSHTAVNPSSVYGASKRVGELLVASMSGRTKFCAVRLTNVIDTRGTVLAAFTRQIQNGGPVSITDPEVARYFLTISEVAGLVIQAAALAEGGDIFLLDTGEQVRIEALAERLIRFRGMEPGKDIKIVYTGLRPGEKVTEALTAEHERLEPTAHSRVLSAVSSRRFSGAELRAGIREIEVDRRRHAGSLPARLHALARIDASQQPPPEEPAASPVETSQEP